MSDFPDPAKFKRTLAVLVVFNALIVGSVIGYFFFVYKDINDQDAERYVNGMYFFAEDAQNDTVDAAVNSIEGLSWVRAAAAPDGRLLINGSIPFSGGNHSLILVWTEWVLWDQQHADEAKAAAASGGLNVSGPFRVRSDFDAPARWGFFSSTNVNWRTYRISQPGTYTDADWMATNYNLMARYIQNATSGSVLTLAPGAQAAQLDICTFGTDGQNEANFHVWGAEPAGYGRIIEEALSKLGDGFSVTPV